MARKRTARSDSIEQEIETMRQATWVVDPPAGTSLKSEAELLCFRQLAEARAPADWKAWELRLIVKVVRYEMQIQKALRILEDSTPLTKNGAGTLKASPTIDVIDRFERLQMSILRGLHMTKTDIKTETLAERAEKVQKARAKIAAPKSLLARPN